MQRPQLYAQQELLAYIRNMARDTQERRRYTDEEIYRCLDLALMRWGKYRSPYILPVDGAQGARRIPLPDYVDGRIQVQGGYGGAWRTLQGWRVTHDAERGEGLVLELGRSPSVEGLRVVWYVPPPSIPVQLPRLSEEASPDARQIEISRPADFTPARAGWVLVGNDEWVFYGGYSPSAQSLRLDNLERGLHGTPATAHAEGVEVGVGVAIGQEAERYLLAALTMSQMHALWMTDGSNQERDHHATMIRYWDEQAAQTRRSLQGRQPALHLTAEALRGL